MVWHLMPTKSQEDPSHHCSGRGPARMSLAADLCVRRTPGAVALRQLDSRELVPNRCCDSEANEKLGPSKADPQRARHHEQADQREKGTSHP
jgi:hypothetical protein